MIIELEGPYASMYRKGYLRTCKDGRKRVDLFNTNKDRTTVSYAKYLLTIKENRLLLPTEEADHIDNDRSNDSLDNLQILEVSEHKKKTKHYGKKHTMVEETCSHCGKVFLKNKRYVNKVYKLGPVCSRSCNGLRNKAYLHNQSS